jgi:hypothetical protein
MASLKDRVKARRDELREDHTFVLPVPGYEDVGLAARYKTVPYEGLRKIGEKPDILAVKNEGQRELMAFADTLILGCVELLEEVGRDDHGNPEYRSLGHGWTAAGVRDHLLDDLPEGATARDAVLAVFSGPNGGNRLAQHVRLWDTKADEINSKIDSRVEGESGASEEAKSTSELSPVLPEPALS